LQQLVVIPNFFAAAAAAAAAILYAWLGQNARSLIELPK
jgi:hypothetical protein